MFKDFAVWCIQISHLWYWSFGCQPQMCSKWLKAFTLVMQEMRNKGSVCNMTDVSSWEHVNFKADYSGRYSKNCGHTECSESLSAQYYKHSMHVCSCFLDAKPQEYQTSPEKVSLSRENLFIPAYSGTNQEGKGWKKHLCWNHVYKAKNWKSDKLAPPRVPHNQ